MGIPQTIQLANLGMADSLILMVLALVVFGPRRLPQIGRQLGKLMYEFRKASNDFKFQMEEELRNAEEADRRKKEEERLKALALNAPAPESPVSETAPAENPYPWDSVYPPVSASVSETPAAELDSAEVAVPAVEARPVLQPPSTGEVVAANPPRAAVVVEAAAAPPARDLIPPSGPSEVERSGAPTVATPENPPPTSPEPGLSASAPISSTTPEPSGQVAEQAHHG